MGNDSVSLGAVHKQKLKQMLTELEGMAGSAQVAANAIKQALEQGGMALIQPQVAFMTGAQARLQKDWGSVETLQNMGIRQRKPPSTR